MTDIRSMARPTTVVNFDSNPVLNEAQTARLLDLSPITLKRKRREPDCGGLPYVRLSTARIGYLQSDVHDYIAARRVTGSATT